MPLPVPSLGCIGEIDGFGCQVVAAELMLFRQQPSRRVEPPRMRLAAYPLLERQDDVGLWIPVAPLVMPTMNFQVRTARADGFGGRPVSERGMLLGEKVIEDKHPIQIRFLRPPFLDGCNDLGAGQRLAQVVAPLLESR
jgi:hypothetical protein